MGFLRHGGYRWLKASLAMCALASLGYVLIDVTPRPNGGSWYGYSLGTLGLLLILWLALLGVRKRAMTRGRWSLKAWTSAHVYLGLGLAVVATLHSGFQFGWNVHTLAYALMMLVIASGLWGVIAYAAVPVALGSNRAEMTEAQMVEALRSADRALHDAAQPLGPQEAALVLRSLRHDPFGDGLWVRLAGRDRRCPTVRAAQALGDESEGPVAALLAGKVALLARVRRHLRLKALLQLWLYFHVPLTFMLIAALTAHVVSVFFYW